MKNSEINIRDPFVLCKDNTYYMYGTRAVDFGIKTGGFDVYKGTDLSEWSAPKEVFSSRGCGLNDSSNWAPEVHEFKGAYYMFATFQQPNGNRGTYSLKCDTPDGEFKKHSQKALTPEDWFSLDGTLYVSPRGEPYLVFCHEHVQIKNGTVCYVKLSHDLDKAIGEPRLLFSASDAYGFVPRKKGSLVTDGPFMYRGKNNRLYMIWSTFSAGSYAQCLAVSDNGDIDGNWTQLEHIFKDDGGHGMVFTGFDGRLRLVLHSPNESLWERPVFFELEDNGERLSIVK